MWIEHRDVRGFISSYQVDHLKRRIPGYIIDVLCATVERAAGRFVVVCIDGARDAGRERLEDGSDACPLSISSHAR